MARSTLAKAFGVKRSPFSDTTWQPLPTSMLKLLIEIADAEKQLEAQRTADEAPASCSHSSNDSHSNA